MEIVTESRKSVEYAELFLVFQSYNRTKSHDLLLDFFWGNSSKRKIGEHFLKFTLFW